MCKEACASCRLAKVKCLRREAFDVCCERCSDMAAPSSSRTSGSKSKTRSLAATTTPNDARKVATKKKAARKRAAMVGSAKTSQSTRAQSTRSPGSVILLTEGQEHTHGTASPASTRGSSERRVGTTPFTSCSPHSSSVDLEHGSPELPYLPALPNTAGSAEHPVSKSGTPVEAERADSLTRSPSVPRGFDIRANVMPPFVTRKIVPWDYRPSFVNLAPLSNSRNDEDDEPAYGSFGRIDFSEMVED